MILLLFLISVGVFEFVLRKDSGERKENQREDAPPTATRDLIELSRSIERSPGEAPPDGQSASAEYNRENAGVK